MHSVRRPNGKYPGKKLSGDHCQCSACGEYFNSTYAFDKHRSGDYARRYCLSPEQMLAIGMAQNAKGFWIGQKMHDSAKAARQSSRLPVGGT